MKIFNYLILSLFFLFNQVQSQIIEIGNCYRIDGYQIQNKWNVNDYVNSNTLYYKFLKEPVRKKSSSNSYWVTQNIEAFIWEDDEIKKYQESGYNQFKKWEKHVLSINLNNGIITELKVQTDESINYNRENITILKKLKKRFPNKWTYGDYGDQQNLNYYKNRILEKTDIDKHQIETYVDGLIIARNLEDLQYSNGRAIKINLNTMKYAWGFFDTIVNSEDDYFCNKNYKNINIKKDTTKQKSNSGLKELLKKIY